MSEPGSVETADLLAEYARLMNAFGVDSREAAAFAQEHAGNAEFARLAQVAALLKRAFDGQTPIWTSDTTDQGAEDAAEEFARAQGASAWGITPIVGGHFRIIGRPTLYAVHRDPSGAWAVYRRGDISAR